MERWRNEGMPEHVHDVDFFDLDHISSVGADNSPRYPVRMIEETDAYKVQTTSWGLTLKNWKHAGGTPEYLAFTIKEPDSWQQAKMRMQPSDDRIDWEDLRKNYTFWRERGDFITAGLWFGFDVTHSWMIGTETALIAIMEKPEWLRDMYATELDVHLALLDRIWEKGYTFDAIRWPDDMGYKHNQFFSQETFRELVKPFHRRAAEWAHAKGIKAMMHSCGDINPFVPELIEIGIDPLEVKAGMDPVHLKQTYGDKLVLHGGINAVLWDQPDKIMAEMKAVIPAMKQNGGYIFASDHSIPNSVSLEDFRRIIAKARELGSYA